MAAGLSLPTATQPNQQSSQREGYEMNILKLIDGVPGEYSLRQLRRDNTNVSFPDAPNAEVLASYSCYAYTRPPRPAFEGLVERVVDADFAQDPDGSWSRGWAIERLGLADAERNIRNERTSRLRETDDYTLAQLTTLNPMPLEISQYQTALRDVPQQAGFPYSVTWPTKPVIL